MIWVTKLKADGSKDYLEFDAKTPIEAMSKLCYSLGLCRKQDYKIVLSRLNKFLIVEDTIEDVIYTTPICE